MVSPVVNCHTWRPPEVRQYTLASLEPTYTRPSEPTVGADTTEPPVVNRHTTAPFVDASAYSFRSLEPTYTTEPSTLRPGDDHTPPPVAVTHNPLPPLVYAYTLPLSLPTNTLPDTSTLALE